MRYPSCPISIYFQWELRLEHNTSCHNFQLDEMNSAYAHLMEWLLVTSLQHCIKKRRALPSRCSMADTARRRPRSENPWGWTMCSSDFTNRGAEEVQRCSRRWAAGAWSRLSKAGVARTLERRLGPAGSLPSASKFCLLHLARASRALPASAKMPRHASFFTFLP